MPKHQDDISYSSDEMSRKHNKRKHKDKNHYNRENRYHHKYRSRSRSRSPHEVRVKREEDSYDKSPGRYKSKKHKDGYRDRHKHHRSRDEHHRQIKPEPAEEQRRDREQNNERRREKRRQVDQFGDLSEAFGVGVPDPSQDVKIEKEGPNFEVSGKLAEDTNTYKGVVIKYNEPPEARKPKKRWRLYAFKGENVLPMLQIHRQSAFLMGRDRVVADIPTDHPSCSKQHAVLQYRLVDHEREDGSRGRRVKPYIIDLDSSNGTYVNNQRIESRCYVELFEKDVLKFGFSSREYVLLHDSTQEDQGDNDPGEALS
ncbi:hypothetical protein ScPMuIL_013258 [Solemya velum]